MTRASLLGAIWRQNRLLPVAILVLLVGNLLGYLLLATRVWPRLAERERAFIALQSQVRSGRQAQQRSPQEALRQARADWQRFRAAVPERAALPLLVEEFAGLARESGVAVGAVGYQPKELDDAQLLAYALQFSVTGGYPQVKRFLQEVEGSRRLIEIESLNASSRVDRDGLDQVTLALRLVTYFRSEGP